MDFNFRQYFSFSTVWNNRAVYFDENKKWGETLPKKKGITYRTCFSAASVMKSMIILTTREWIFTSTHVYLRKVTDWLSLFLSTQWHTMRPSPMSNPFHILTGIHKTSRSQTLMSIVVTEMFSIVYKMVIVKEGGHFSLAYWVYILTSTVCGTNIYHNFLNWKFVFVSYRSITKWKSMEWSFPLLKRLNKFIDLTSDTV